MQICAKINIKLFEEVSKLYREIIKKLENWKKSSKRKPLIVNGARQVGKTWILKEFGANYYEKIAYINMDNNHRMKELFNNYDMETIIQGLKIESGVSIEPENTLIILDEIQEIPKAISALKYFNENANEYHIIVAGSLLGVALHEGVSFPVGKVDMLNMYPLNFKEYLMATGKQDYAKIIENRDEKLLSIFSENIKRCLREYYYVGGMPEVVNDFAINKDYNSVREIQNIILKDYENDFSKHVPKSDLQKVIQIWNNFNTQLAKENKKFIFGAVKPSARASEYENAINWLISSGLLYKVNRVNDSKMPLNGYIDYNAFKLYFLDVGLLSAKNNLDVRAIIDGNKIFTEYKGSLTEQYVLQEIKSNYNLDLFYWTSSSYQAEIDFVIQYDNMVIPIEVKAEINLQAKSLKRFIEKYGGKVNIRTSMADYRIDGMISNIPLYVIGDFDKYILK